jgi:ribosomal protein S18 acetylase RimI-like enzyme
VNSPRRAIAALYSSSHGQIQLRPATDADLPLLRRIYVSTRAAELEPVPWSDDQKREFLAFQFDAQHRYYLAQFPQASRDLIELDGEPVGRLYLDPRPSEIRLIDIALLAEHCGKGIGGLLLAAVLEAGRASGRRVGIHVEQNNPAMRLYLRLGFEKIEEQGIYHLMRWSPAESTVTENEGSTTA